MHGKLHCVPIIQSQIGNFATLDIGANGRSGGINDGSLVRFRPELITWAAMTFKFRGNNSGLRPFGTGFNLVLPRAASEWYSRRSR
jgi:hypothetical protein